MTPNSPLRIEPVGNGWIVSPAQDPESMMVISSGSMHVFQNMHGVGGLLPFIAEHFGHPAKMPAPPPVPDPCGWCGEKSAVYRYRGRMSCLDCGKKDNPGAPAPTERLCEICGKLPPVGTYAGKLACWKCLTPPPPPSPKPITIGRKVAKRKAPSRT